MLTYQGSYTKCQKLSQDFSSGALSFFQDEINVGKRKLEALLGIYHLEDSDTDTTVADQDSYPLPARCVRLKSIYVTVGGRRYIPEPVFDEELWQALKAGYPDDSTDFVTRFFPRSTTVELFPTPASSGNEIKMFFEATQKDFSQADYTTGTISTLTNGAKAVTGVGTTWTSAMIGRAFKIDSHPQEFRIAGVTDTTHLTLLQKYDGISIAAGSETYKIGEVLTTPESTHNIPIYWALWRYYLGFKQSGEKAKEWKGLYEEEVKEAVRLYGKRFSSKYIPPQKMTAAQAKMVNPNLYPAPLT